MLTTRIVGVINILDGIAVQSLNFKRYLPIGKPEIAVSYLNQWGIDDIVILDIKSSVKVECSLYQKLAGQKNSPRHAPVTTQKTSPVMPPSQAK